MLTVSVILLVLAAAGFALLDWQRRRRVARAEERLHRRYLRTQEKQAARTDGA